MILPIFFANDERINLLPALPNEWSGLVLPGSQPYSYAGDAGTIVVQKFQGEKFSIQYSIIQFMKRIVLHWKEASILRLEMMLTGTLDYNINRDKHILLSGQANFVWSPNRETRAVFKKGRTYTMLQACYKPELIQSLTPDFPHIFHFPHEQSNQWISADLQNSIESIFSKSYPSEAQSFFYENFVRGLLLSFLIHSEIESGEETLSLEEIERIHQVDRLILSDLTTHYSIPELSKKMKIGEAKLKWAFKKIIGVGLYERYKEARLQHAKHLLLQTDIQVKNINSLVGYESITGFSDAFKERFGLPPYKYRKKYRPIP